MSSAEVHAGVALRQEAVVELGDNQARQHADDGEGRLTSRLAGKTEPSAVLDVPL